jgi:colicin import membrane protein
VNFLRILIKLYSDFLTTNKLKDIVMKRSFWVIALLISILMWGLNASVFAQDQVIKDTKVQDVKKDVVKKGDVKKQDMIKKADTKKEDMVKKGDAKKQDMIKKADTKKEEMVKKGDTKKEEMMKKGDTKKQEMIKKADTKKEDMKNAKTVIKDKEAGKTADGKTIYEGPKGGKYTISASGKKVYLKKDAK